jgi:hypothetical protein
MSLDDLIARILPPGSAKRLVIAVASGIICGAALGFLGVPYLKAITIGAIAAIASFTRFGTRWIQRIAIVLGGIALGVWIDVLPPLNRWRALIFSFFPPG